MKTFLWFTIIFSAFIIGCGALIGFASIGGPGPGAPLEGQAKLASLSLIVASGLVIAACFYFMPKISFRSISISTVIYLAVVFSVYFLIKNSGEKIVRLHIYDPSGKAISGAQVEFEHFPAGGGASSTRSKASGVLISDNAGLVSIFTDSRHNTRGRIHFSGYTDIEFDLDRQWGKLDQQYFIRWLNPLVTPNPSGLVKSVDCRSYMGYIPSTRTVDITVYLPIIGSDAPLPYAENKEPNKALQTTIMAVTDSAAQTPRQP